MVVDLEYVERGKGYWKFNNLLLQDREYLQVMNNEIDLCIKSMEQKTPKEAWVVLKERIKKVTEKYSRQKATRNTIEIANLSEKVNTLLSSLPLNREDMEILCNAQEELDKNLTEKANAAMFRSKVRWHEYGEKNSSYFFSLEKARYNAKTCYKLINDNQEETTDTQKILELQKDFYKNLYSKDNNVSFELPNTYGIFVPLNIKEDQDKQITMMELELAIFKMNNNKTPGQDGIPVDFYKVFWGRIKKIFHAMVIQSYDDEELPTSASRGILNLIPKANKDTRLIKNLRPITLLNVDYKIIEKAIANKMLPALDKIISKDQRGFMKDRRISVNIRKILDIMHQTEEKDLEAVILSLDFVKCFDKCSFSILHGSLKFFRFGEIVKKWTYILYNNFRVKVQNNGHFSCEFDVQKGVHQGGCCSSVYFLVIAEILALSLRHNDQIEGITLHQIRNLLNQFADDMDIATKCTKESIEQIYKELNNFYYQSGFEVSYDKTTLYRIGSLRHSNAMLYDLDQFKWSNEDITILGVTIAHEDIVYKNYNGMQDSVKQILNSWANRGLSLIGKIQVVNTLIASLFVYKMMVLPVIPRKVVKNLDNVIREFIWNGKKAKISYRILQNSRKAGGLGLVNLEYKDKALKATWPHILSKEEEYGSLVYGIMRCSTIGSNIWKCRLLAEDVKTLKIKSEFWEQVLTAWSEYNFMQDFRIENQILWYNSSIRIKGKPFLWADVYTSGLLYVHQLFEKMEFKSDQEVMQQYNLNKLRYNSLKVSIPLEWKKWFMSNMKSQYMPIPPHTYDSIISLGKKQLSSMIYRYMVDDEFLLHPKLVKWQAEIGEHFAESIWQYADAHVKINKLTIATKFRSFQYRVIQRALVTNVQLYKWGIVSSNLCYFCQQQEETMLHLLVTCPIVNQLWCEMFQFIKEQFKVEVLDVSPKAIILNEIVLHKRYHVANFLCLIGKQYIYSQKCLGQSLSFAQLQSRFRCVESVEKYIAIKANKYASHERKWKGNVTQQGSIVDFVQEYNDNISENS